MKSKSSWNLNFLFLIITLINIIKDHNEKMQSPIIYPINFISLNKDIIIIDSKG